MSDLITKDELSERMKLESSHWAGPVSSIFFFGTLISTTALAWYLASSLRGFWWVAAFVGGFVLIGVLGQLVVMVPVMIVIKAVHYRLVGNQLIRDIKRERARRTELDQS